MTGKRVIPTLAATVACALGVVPAASASTDVQTASSANWAGYVVGGSSSATRYKSVSGSWVAPTAKCTSGQSYSSFWVGLGGASSGSSSASDASSWSDPSGMSGSGSTSGSGSSTSLEQAGTEADCNADGSATYSAWYELVPSPPVKVSMAVHPGDHITTKVTVDGSSVTIQLTNATTGGSFTKTLPASNPDVSSAEWIAEAPSTCSQGLSNCTPLSLADFGTAQFSGASATTTDGHTGTISDSNWQTAAVTLSPSASQDGFGGQFASYDASGSAGATPSSLSSDGSSFSVAWTSDGSSAGSSAGSSGGSAGSAGSDGSSGYGDPSGGYGGDGGYGGYGGYGGWGGYGSYGGGGYGGDGGWGGYGFAYVPGAYSY
jgi:Peptidase A4 family